MFLNERETVLVSDLLSRSMLNELVTSERSASELARKLDVPTLKVWRRMQKLLGEGIVELSGTRKSGNLEIKLYRATAASFVPAQLLTFKPKDGRLSEAFEIFSEIQKSIMVLYSSSEIPKNADPFDFALYANMRAFVNICGGPDAQEKISELERKLSEYAKDELKDMA